MSNDEMPSIETKPRVEARRPDAPTGIRANASRVLSSGGSRLGLLVIAIGLVVIGVGWNGAAGSGGEINHVPVVQAQLPWLLSGGFLGLGIIVLGAAMVIANAYRESEARLAARFEQLLEALERGPNVAARPDAGASDPNEGELVVAGSASFHRPDCRLVKGRSEARLIGVSTALDLGLTPCRICHPIATEPNRRPARSYSNSASPT
jgi:hypothetical protein